VSASDREKRGQGHGQGQGRYAEASGDRLLCYAVPYWTGLGWAVMCCVLFCCVMLAICSVLLSVLLHHYGKFCYVLQFKLL
jgi:ABC-type Fe3+ transport system permease subunit